ncbi:hypothetical protein GCM10010273_17040 [Streptomyces lavendulocolor]
MFRGLRRAGRSARRARHTSESEAPGARLASVQLPVKPKEADAPGATVPFQPAFFAVTAVPLWAKLAFHI